MLVVNASTNKHSWYVAKSLRPWPNMAALLAVICHKHYMPVNKLVSHRQTFASNLCHIISKNG